MMIRAMTMVFLAVVVGLLPLAAAGGGGEPGCPDGLCSCDQNLDGDVQINELVGGVNNLLDGCDAESAACVEQREVRSTSTRVSATEELIVPLDGDLLDVVFHQKDWDTADNFDAPPAEGTMGVTIPAGAAGVYLLHAHPRWAFSSLEGTAAGTADAIFLLTTAVYVNETLVGVTNDFLTASILLAATAAGLQEVDFAHAVNVTELLEEGDIVSMKVQWTQPQTEGTVAGTFTGILVSSPLALVQLAALEG